jgi:hypothetical protein
MQHTFQAFLETEPSDHLTALVEGHLNHVVEKHTV